MEPNPIVPGEVREAVKPQAIRREDLSLTDYTIVPGGPLGRQTLATIHHPSLGSRPFASCLPMTEEAVLDWISLTTSDLAYKRMKELGGGRVDDLPKEKPQGLWHEDPAAAVKEQIRLAKERGEQLPSLGDV